MVIFLFSVHSITEAKQQAGRSQGALPARSLDLACPGVAPPLPSNYFFQAAQAMSMDPAARGGCSGRMRGMHPRVSVMVADRLTSPHTQNVHAQNWE